MHNKIQMKEKEKYPMLYAYSVQDMKPSRRLMCIGGCESFIYSADYEIYRCDACYDKEMERKANESTVNRDM